MSEKNGKRETQKTDTGYEIPVPKRKDVLGLFDKAAKKQEPSRPAKGKRRTSRDDP